LLYIPSKAPFDLWDRQQRRGIKLYVRRVFIMDDAEQLMPAYLRFVRGVVDSADLPLNVSREILQQSKDVEAIRSGCVRRVLGLLDELVADKPEKYAEFWREFGVVLKEGVGEDFSNRDRIAKLLPCRWPITCRA
jgi:molecular chaperone HtpG